MSPLQLKTLCYEELWPVRDCSWVENGRREERRVGYMRAFTKEAMNHSKGK